MTDYSQQKKTESRKNYVVVAVAVALLGILMFVNIHVMYDMAASQAEEIGSMRMENIVTELQQTLKRAQNALIRVGANLEEMLEGEASAEQIREFLVGQKDMEVELSGGNCLNVFCAVHNVVYVSGMETPDNYVLQDRNWYKGLMAQKKGEVYISQVYDDAFTDQRCFTVARVLEDGQTIIGLDYSIADIQASVEAMSEDGYGDALIADKDGTIVGYQDASLLGEKLSSKLPAYQSVFTKAVTSGGSDQSFSMTSREGRNTVFCNRTENGWYLMLRVSNWELYRESYLQFAQNIILTVLIMTVFVVLYLSASRQRMRAQHALEEKEEFLSTLPEAFRASFTKMAETERDSDRTAKKKVWKAVTSRERHWFELAIIGTLILTMLITITITTSMTSRWGRSRMEEEARGYNYQVSAWILEQKSILDLFSYAVAAKPEMLDDYEGMVEFLDRITKHYQGISATYIANPDFPHGHPMVMNNGWVPEEDYVEEERPWYTGAVDADDGFSITEPYYDARTGKYCVTFSKKVETDGGQFLGVFAIDFYLDVLIEILGDGYSGVGYAFMVDKDGRIINHPNPEYQFTGDSTTNVHEVVYDKVYDAPGIVLLKDYDGKWKACISMEESLSNFKVIVVNDFWNIYGDLVRYTVLFLILFGICIGAVMILMQKMVRWQRETDVQLKEAADAARAADQAKSLFLAQMSHEIRTPINAVLGMNEMILRENSDSNIQEYAEQIRSAGATLLSLINGILDFTKIESGRMEIQPVQYETAAMIRNLTDLVADRAQVKQLELRLEIDPTLPEILYGDDVRVRQIITNLLTNAVKYTREGSVTLTMQGRARTEKEITLYVEVKDTGIGIRQEDMERLFGMFQRLDEEKNRNVEGTGLGIPIVQNLLHMMGSELHVESTYGKGSVFSFELKQQIVFAKEIGDYRQSLQRQAGQAMEQKYVYAPDAHILVVDDNVVNLRVTRNLLKRNGMQVDTASSGMECIELVRNNAYHIIFLDHMMPQMDGIETYQKLIAENLLRDAAVIMMTANETVGAREEYLNLGFTDYIAKPIDIKQLEQMLEKHLPKELVSHRAVRGKNGGTAQAKTGEQTQAKPGAAQTKTDAQPQAEKGAQTQTEPDAAQAENDAQMQTEPGAAQAENGAQMQTEPDAAQAENDAQMQTEPGAAQIETGEQTQDAGEMPGVDISVGLVYCADSMEFYLEMLEEYTNQNLTDDLEKYRADEDWDNYLIQVHSLKSSSRTIGAVELSEQALAMETSVREKDIDYALEHHEALMQAYREILGVIRDYLARR